MSSIQVIELEDWNEFKQYVQDNFTVFPAYVFRGQRDSDWEIISTLTRLANSVSIDAKALENKQLELFQKRIRGLRGANPPKLSSDELWSLGQHYGLATPLIDWSESPYIAAYFAFEHVENPKCDYRSVYVLSRYGLANKLEEKGIKDVSFVESLQDDNSRIIAQAGLFTKLPTGLSFEQWLIENELGGLLVELRIPTDYRLEALNDLRAMNIQANTIYPDLHGAAISCNMWHENVSDNIEQKNRINNMLKQLELTK
ncbi:TPA: FRG domain-containing protein [Vibrio parahaemolyticus]|uniref:FRG domain-containing protein n=1 Tax=Vibrio rotiferianus TaxID=190895 RepID=A0A510I5U9_9VIBR|nr:FRG domain-containing protein [Vibrio rotiferianus]BBL88989.1 FRG domain-containing protein [Vibrio rotiferianus]HCH5323759.1 FRG domain-containing protein [Vibrio parahaemolyticus]